VKIAVTATEPSLAANVDPRFGRCPHFLIIDTDTMEFQALANPSVSAPSGAGIQSAQLVADQGVQCVLTGNCGPNAHATLAAAGVQVILACSGPVQAVVEQFKASPPEPAAGPNVPGGFGTGDAGGTAQPPQGVPPGMPGGGMGGGMGGGRGGGMGRGGGGGMGRGRGGGMGRGRGGGRGGGGGGGMGGGQNR
jgi:predicted Fe-Mo cluster-binding NifX family protein